MTCDVFSNSLIEMKRKLIVIETKKLELEVKLELVGSVAVKVKIPSLHSTYFYVQF